MSLNPLLLMNQNQRRNRKMVCVGGNELNGRKKTKREREKERDVVGKIRKMSNDIN